MHTLARALSCCALALTLACTGSDVEPPVDAARANWPPELTAIVDRAVSEFDVPTVSVADFETLPAGTVLFDVRTAAEASVSTIPNAQLLADEQARQALLDAPPAGPVVVSCAAGWRSARFTQALRAKGVEAYNLEGGIFAWVAAGRTIHDPAGAPTKRVHTYNDSWAKCLPADHEVVLEPAP